MPGEPTLITVETKSCAHVTVIEDTKVNNWFGACDGLIKKPGITDMAVCEATCHADLNCTVWRMTNSSVGLEEGCFQGSLAHHCRTATVGGLFGVGDEKPKNIMGGQRIQHGEVIEVSNNMGRQTKGLLKMSENAAATGNGTMLVERCKSFCYTDTFCTVWQYGKDGCWVEHYPGFTATGTTNTSKWAYTMVAGQTIKHVCPPEAEADEGGLPYGWIAFGAIAGAILLGVLAYAFLRPKGRTTSKQDDGSDEELSEELGSEGESADLLDVVE